MEVKEKGENPNYIRKISEGINEGSGWDIGTLNEY
jgi:hypothetical protein